MAQKDMEKAEALKAEVADLKERMPELETQDRAIGEELLAMLLAIPNLPAEDVPIGPDESANIELARRTEERSVGKECVSTCRCRGSPDYSKKKYKANHTTQKARSS